MNNRLSRLRALTELEGPLQTHRSELHDLRELQEEQGGGGNLYEELEAQWKKTHKAFSDRLGEARGKCRLVSAKLRRFFINKVLLEFYWTRSCSR